MAMVARTLGRIILVPIAFLIAALAAGFVIVTLGLEKFTVAMNGRDFESDPVTPFFDLLRNGSALASGLTIIPALAVVIIGEVARIRSATYYIVGGGLALAAIPFLASAASGSPGLAAAGLWQVLATAGFAAGLIYWLLAGRNA
jgi:hypothetical protein